MLTFVTPGKQCILTIKRPNGASRSYKTEAVFKKRADAKSEVCGMGIDMGALDFILTGESEVLKAKKGDVDVDSRVRLCQCCRPCPHQRKPHWVSLGESKVGHGVRNRRSYLNPFSVPY